MKKTKNTLVKIGFTHESLSFWVAFFFTGTSILYALNDNLLYAAYFLTMALVNFYLSRQSLPYIKKLELLRNDAQIQYASMQDSLHTIEKEPEKFKNNIKALKDIIGMMEEDEFWQIKKQ